MWIETYWSVVDTDKNGSSPLPLPTSPTGKKSPDPAAEEVLCSAAMASVLSNGGDLPSKPASAGRHAGVYSEVQTSRLDHRLLLPSVLKGSAFKVVDGPASSAAGNPGWFNARLPSFLVLHVLLRGVGRVNCFLWRR